MWAYFWPSKAADKIHAVIPEQKPVHVRAWLNYHTLLRRQMFPSLAALETYVAETNFVTWKQEVFLPQVKTLAFKRCVSQLSHHENKMKT